MCIGRLIDRSKGNQIVSGQLPTACQTLTSATLLVTGKGVAKEWLKTKMDSFFFFRSQTRPSGLGKLASPSSFPFNHGLAALKPSFWALVGGRGEPKAIWRGSVLTGKVAHLWPPGLELCVLHSTCHWCHQNCMLREIPLDSSPAIDQN